MQHLAEDVILVSFLEYISENEYLSYIHRKYLVNSSIYEAQGGLIQIKLGIFIFYIETYHYEYGNELPFITKE